MPFANSVVPGVFFVPEGHRENSPAFQRWEHDPKAVSPEGTADLNAECKMKSAEFQSSLRDLRLSASIPSLEKAGLFSFVPPGHKTANLRKALRPGGAAIGGKPRVNLLLEPEEARRTANRNDRLKLRPDKFRR